jgi:hypothetical protein
MLAYPIFGYSKAAHQNSQNVKVKGAALSSSIAKQPAPELNRLISSGYSMLFNYPNCPPKPKKNIYPLVI